MKTTAITAANRSYYPALDGLRGIAILVVLCHHNLNFIPNFELGWVGVDLFFVLSGFLITDILLKTKEHKNFLPHFYIRRILRIFPLYYGAVLLFFIVVPFCQNLRVQYEYYHNNQAAVWLHLQNWLYIFKEKPGDSLLLNHFWSLSVEEQFYLIWPLLILSVKKIRRLGQIAIGILALCIIARFCSWLYLGNGYTNFHFQFMTRADGLCVGSLLAIWRFTSYVHARKNILRLASWLLGIHAVTFILAKTIFIGLPLFSFLGYSSVAVLFGLLVFFTIEKTNAWSKTLATNSPLRFAGKISYGLYVYHWPILILTKLYLMDSLLSKGFSFNTSYMILSLVALIIAVFVSIASYYLLERKLLLLKDVVTTEGFFSRARKKIMLLLRPASSR